MFLFLFASVLCLTLSRESLNNHGSIVSHNATYHQTTTPKKNKIQYIYSGSGGSRNLSSLPSSQMEALKDLYDYTAGRYWLWRTKHNVSIENHYTVWNFTGNHNPCEEKWQGVLCSCESNTSFSTIDINMPSVSYVPSPNATNCSVIALVLVIFNMTGKLPLSIGNLTTLQFLSFSFNNLSGPIPPTFGKMSDLQLFQVDYNRFTGYIPVEMYSLKEIRYFYFLRYALIRIFVKEEYFIYVSIFRISNYLQGPLPTQVLSFTKMFSLSLNFNNFTGRIPNCYGSLPSLISLYLSSNRLTGPIPVSLGNLSKLRLLYINDNLLTGTIPSSLTNLTHLVDLNCKGNHLRGPIPVGISNMLNLVTLDLGNNYLTGPIPVDIFYSKLNTITLGVNYLTGLSFFFLSLLIAVIDDYLQGPIPHEIVNINKSLAVFSAPQNLLEGSKMSTTPY